MDDDTRLLPVLMLALEVTFLYFIVALILANTNWMAGGVKLLEVPLHYTKEQFQHYVQYFGVLDQIKKQQKSETANGYVFLYFKNEESAKNLLQYTSIV